MKRYEIIHDVNVAWDVVPDENGSIVYWTDIAPIIEGAPSKGSIDCAAETLRQWADKHPDDACAWCAATSADWLRKIAEVVG